MNNITPMAADGLNDIVIKRVFELADQNKEKNISILDLGSGQGYNAEELSRLLTDANIPFTITCIDINKDQFKLSDKPYIEFFEHDLNQGFPFQKKFDFVIGTEIIEHVENPYYFLRTCIGALAPQGYFFFTTPNPEHIFSLIKQLFLGRPMWFSVNEPSGHITPIHNFMVQEAMRRIACDMDRHYSIERSFNRNCFPSWIKGGKLFLSTVPGNNRVFGEINIFKISAVASTDHTAA